MRRKVLIVRFWLLMALVAVLTVFWPSVGIACWPLLGMIPCCCDFCGACTSQPRSQIQITISGCVNGATCSDCVAEMNGVFVLDYTVFFPGQCTYRVDGDYTTCSYNILYLAYSDANTAVMRFCDGGQPAGGNCGNGWSKANAGTNCAAWNFTATLFVNLHVGPGTATACECTGSTAIVEAI